ncbi:MAG: AMP-binding protein [Spirochaetaceae bacterium]|jgi:amino acid adenylation domain-containing protein|nr:AMP-binding protein [Spirochaetaceae bacterium]
MKWDGLSRITGETIDLGEQTVVNLLRESAAKHPDNIALVHKDFSISYKELDALTDYLAHSLIQNGVRRGERVGLLIPRGELVSIGAYAVLKSGAAYVALDPGYPLNRLAFIAEDAAIKFILADKSLSLDFSEFKAKIIDFRALIADKPLGGAHYDLPKIKLSDPACFIYTSGSTGKPKGVELFHLNLVSELRSYTALMSIDSRDKVASFVSFSFVAHTVDIYPTFSAGACLDILSDEIRLSPQAVNAYITENNITLAFFPTAFGKKFAVSETNRTLRTVTVAGERFLPYEKFTSNYLVRNVYGASETTGLISAALINPHGRDTFVGKPSYNHALYIVDDTGNIVPLGERGELWAAGPSVSLSGYLNLPEKTAESFIKNPFEDNKLYERLYKLGDIASILPDGHIQIYGRKDFQVKIRGFRVETAEIDSMISLFENVAESVTAAFTGRDGENSLVSYISLEDKNKTFDKAALKKYIGKELPPYMIPAALVVIDSLPRNNNGKIDRSALPEYVPETDTPEHAALPLKGPEKTVAGIVAAVLHIPPDILASNTDLMSMGLHSLLVFEIISEIVDEFGVEISSGDIMKSPSVQNITALIKTAKNAGTRLSQPAPDAKTGETRSERFYPLSSHQRSLLEGYQREPLNTKDNISVTCEFSENTDVEKLKSALEAAFLTHPMISAKMVKTESRGYMWERRLTPGVFIESAEMDEETFRGEETSFIQPFDLTGGKSLYRAKICKITDSSHRISSVQLLFAIHHTIFDGFSMKLLFNDIAMAYNGKKPLPEKFSAFEEAASEIEHICETGSEKIFDELESRFIKCGGATLFSEQKILEKPEGYPEFLFSKKIPAGKVAEFCKKNSVWPDSVFASVFAALTAQYTGKNDIVFITIFSGRNDHKKAKTVGVFIKTVPLLLHINPRASPVENCRLVQKDLDTARLYGYAFLVKKSKEGGKPLKRMPMMYLFNGDLLDTGKMPVIEGKKLSLHHIDVQTEGCEHQAVPLIPLEFIVAEEEENYCITIKYNALLFDKSFIKGFIDKADDYLTNLIQERHS